MTAIAFNNLTKYYGRVRGIEALNFEVEEGEIFGFIGPNGAGKTTTIRTLLGLVFPTAGSATIFGLDCIRRGDEIRRQVGYLPSEVFYYEGMRVIDLLHYSASFYGKDCTKRIKELAEVMELDLRRKIDDLSYGNKKKVGIVQGLLHDPRLLLLDEPTSGLDPLMQRRFFDLLAAENKRGVTVFFSSHILSEVQHLCHRVAVMKNGSVIRLESVETLRAENYKKVVVRCHDLNLANLPLTGITDFRQENGSARFYYRGSARDLVGVLGQLPLSDVVIEDPSLEEIFLHYYGETR